MADLLNNDRVNDVGHGIVALYKFRIIISYYYYFVGLFTLLDQKYILLNLQISHTLPSRYVEYAWSANSEI